MLLKMRYRMKIYIIKISVLTLVLSIFLIAGCTKSPEKAVVGKWIYSPDGKTIMQLYKDGTITIGNVAGNYKFIDKDHIRINGETAFIIAGFGVESTVLKVAFTNNDNELSLTQSNGEEGVCYKDNKEGKELRQADFINAIRATMHGIEVALLEYAVDSGGVYPKSNRLTDIISRLPDNTFPDNPYTGEPYIVGKDFIGENSKNPIADCQNPGDQYGLPGTMTYYSNDNAKSPNALGTFAINGQITNGYIHDPANEIKILCIHG